MESVFLRILNMSIAASYVIMAVLLLRLLLRRLPKKISYLLWSVVAFRLCCPVTWAIGLQPVQPEAPLGRLYTDHGRRARHSWSISRAISEPPRRRISDGGLLTLR